MVKKIKKDKASEPVKEPVAEDVEKKEDTPEGGEPEEVTPEEPKPESAPEEPKPKPALKVEEPATRKPGYYVVAGKSVTSKKGIQDAGAKVDASMWGDKGGEILKGLVDKEYVEEVK